MHAVAEALCIIGQVAVALPVETVPLAGARGQVLAAAVILDVEAPPFDRSMVDGFAVRAADAVAGARLRVISHQDAGGEPCLARVIAGTCVAINTGAPLPAGADAILMVEHVAAGEKGEAGGAPAVGDWITVGQGPAPGGGIQKRGADAAGGQEVLPVGTLLGAAQIRNSNGAMLGAMVERWAVLAYGSAWSGDSRAAIRTELERLLGGAEVALVSGSLSMGTRDFVPGLAAELGFAAQVEKVRIRPGKPFLLATRGADDDAAGGSRQYLIGLPGNPVSALVCFHRFVRPLLARLAGESVPGLSVAVSTEGLGANGEREFHQAGILNRNVYPPVVQPLAWKGSADIFTLARANALIVHAAGAIARLAGALVQVLEM